jgi:hypothetical protein
MTGRKDMPRIYLTYSPEKVKPGSETWMNEREELIRVLKSAPRMRLNHMVQEVDRSIRELSLSIEAYTRYRKRLLDKIKHVLFTGALAAFLAFFFGDLTMKIIADYPETPFTWALINGTLNDENLIWPFVWLSFVLVITFFSISHIIFPQLKNNTLKNLDNLVVLDNAYKRDIWRRTKILVYKSIDEKGLKHLITPHGRHLGKVERFLENDLNPIYERIQSS